MARPRRNRKRSKNSAEHRNDSTKVLHVPPEAHQQTLVAILRSLLNLPWSEAKRLVKTRRIHVNGNLCLDDARRLAQKDVIHVFEHSRAPIPKEADVVIRYIDPHLVVVEKPSGMTTLRHPQERNWPEARRQLQPTLEECLNRIISKLEKKARQRSSPRVRPVHRLDRETSGLMVFARTVPAERSLVKQFAEHSITRRYWAITHGHPPAMVIDSILIRDRGDGRRGSTADEASPEGKRAVTHVNPKERLGDYTWVECELETGRTHQIRIHLSEKGFPLCGEKVYVSSKEGKYKDKSGAPRIALHAFELGFQHPVTGNKMLYTMQLPQDLVAFIRRLRQK